MSLVLSLFPGADLLGRGFEAEGFCVVRGPDALWGGRIQDFHPLPGTFQGVIGGPPCQVHSNLTRLNGTDAIDLVPEFVRCVREANPAWLIMENVPALIFHPDIPDEWHRSLWSDWDCGGRTQRIRAIWSWPFALTPPAKREGRGEWSLCASQWKTRTGIKNGGTKGMHQTMTTEKAAWLQGYEGIGFSFPKGVSESSSKCLAIHMLGNGVPHAMARAIAKAVREATTP